MVLEEIAESISVRFVVRSVRFVRALRMAAVASVGRDAADEVFDGS